MINLQVTHNIYYPRDFRGTRDPGPEYDRVSDIDEFERWLVQLLKFYQTRCAGEGRASYGLSVLADTSVGGPAVGTSPTSTTLIGTCISNGRSLKSSVTCSEHP